MQVGPYVFASSVSLSRVYEGVHYPRDVTGLSHHPSQGLTLLHLCSGGWCWRHISFGLHFCFPYNQELRQAAHPSPRRCCSPVGPAHPTRAPAACVRAVSLYWSLQRILSSLCYSFKNGKPSTDVQQWAQLASGGGNVAPLEPYTVPYASYMGMLGVMSGLGIASPFIRKMPLNLPSSIVKALARFLLGNIGLFSVPYKYD